MIPYPLYTLAAGQASALVQPVSTVAPGLLNPPVLVAFGGVVVAIIGAISTAALAILREIRSTKTLVTENAVRGAEVGVKRDAKLDRIEVLVNGRYGEVLQELATLRQSIANVSGKHVDQMLADAAQARATNQVTQVAKLIVPKEEPL